MSLILSLATWLLVGSAFAQTLPGTSKESAAAPVELDDPTSKAMVRDMVSQLSDDSVRALLIQRLDAVAEANEQSAESQASAFGIFKQGFQHWQRNATHAFTNLGGISAVFAPTMAVVFNSIKPMLFAKLLLIIALSLAAGLLAERIIAWLFRKRKHELIESFSTTLWGILKILYSRLSFDVLGVFGFLLASNAVLGHYFERESAGYLFATIIPSTIFAGFLAYVVCRFFFAPRRPDLRICKTSDERAMRITISFSLVAAYIVFTHEVFHFLLETADESVGGWEPMRALGFLLNLLMYVVAIAVIWYNRETLSEILTENRNRAYLAIGESASDERSWFAINWPKIAITLLALKYVCVEFVVNLTDVAVYSRAAVFITFIVIFLWPGIDANVSLFVAKGINTPDDETEAAAKARRSMQQGLLRVGRVLVICVVLFALATLWGIDFLHLAEAGLGAKVAGYLLELVMIGLFAYVMWELVSVFVGRWLAREGGEPDDHGAEPGGGGGDAGVMIVVVAIIMVLNNWGVNIGPLLAGAGVIGLAIGFGAQTLVKDIVSGLFFLADDAFRVGEYIDPCVLYGSGTTVDWCIRYLTVRYRS